MSRSKKWAELEDSLTLYAVWAVSTLVDSAFLALWVTVQWGVSRLVVTPLSLTGIDKLCQPPKCSTTHK
jgi:hypothetical protein